MQQCLAPGPQRSATWLATSKMAMADNGNPCKTRGSGKQQVQNGVLCRLCAEPAATGPVLLATQAYLWVFAESRALGGLRFRGVAPGDPEAAAGEQRWAASGIAGESGIGYGVLCMRYGVWMGYGGMGVGSGIGIGLGDPGIGIVRRHVCWESVAPGRHPWVWF